MTREFKPPKPSPAGLYHITKAWVSHEKNKKDKKNKANTYSKNKNVNPENVIMVGDSIDDMLAGYRAGAATVLVSSDVNGHINDVPETDIVIKS